MTIDDTLAERGKSYGNYAEQAKCSQRIKAAFHMSKGWEGLPMDMKESLELIAMKISRVLTGDPYHWDSWHDMEGYSKLVADRIKPGLRTFTECVGDVFHKEEEDGA